MSNMIRRFVSVRRAATLYFETLEQRLLFAATGTPEWTGPIQGHQDFRATAIASLDVNPTLLEFTGYVPADQYTTNIRWGDGAETAGTLTSLGNNRWALSGGHSYKTAGVYSVTFQVKTDADGGDSMGSWTYLAAGEDGIQVIGKSPHAYGSENNPESDLFTFTDTGMTDDAPYRAIIDWGNGQVTEGRVQLNQNMGEVWGTPDYSASGNYTAKVTLERLDTSGHVQTSKQIDVSIDYSLSSIRLDWPGAGGQLLYASDGHVHQSLAEFAAVEPIDQYSNEIIWGDGATSTGAFVDTGRIDAQGHAIFSLVGDHQYAAGDAQYGLDISVHTKDGRDGGFGSGVVTGTERLIVENPSIGSVLWLDPGDHDVSNYGFLSILDPTGVDHDYTVTIDWGDGTNSVGTAANANGSRIAAMGQHAYADRGSYQVTFHVSRPSGNGGTIEVNETFTLQLVTEKELAGRPAANLNFTDGPILQVITPTSDPANPATPTQTPMDSKSAHMTIESRKPTLQTSTVVSLESLLDQDDRLDDFLN